VVTRAWHVASGPSSTVGTRVAVVTTVSAVVARASSVTCGWTREHVADGRRVEWHILSVDGHQRENPSFCVSRRGRRAPSLTVQTSASDADSSAHADAPSRAVSVWWHRPVNYPKCVRRSATRRRPPPRPNRPPPTPSVPPSDADPPDHSPRLVGPGDGRALVALAGSFGCHPRAVGGLVRGSACPVEPRRVTYRSPADWPSRSVALPPHRTGRPHPDPAALTRADHPAPRVHPTPPRDPPRTIHTPSERGPPRERYTHPPNADPPLDAPPHLTPHPARCPALGDVLRLTPPA
jgi:hypothetical protein